MTIMEIRSSKKLNAASKALFASLLLIISPILIVAIFLYFFWGAILYMAIWLNWRKQTVLFVYSDSPTWKDYIEREILPYIQDQAVILNWSERRNWKNSLAVLTFRYFGGYRNFNPIGLVFRPFRHVKTYRFFEAFKKFKHGEPREVEALKNSLLEHLRAVRS